MPRLLEPNASFRRIPPHRLPELMDRPDCDPAELREALATIACANRRLGGERLLRRQVAALLAGREPGPIRLLDVGSGDGEATLRLVARLRARGWEPAVTLADLHGGALRLARERWSRNGTAPGVPDLVRLHGARLPFRDASFELALSTTTLHHMEREEARRFLAELARVSRLGWVVTDLRRSCPAYAAARLLAATLWRRKRLPRRDGPVSVRRAFTPREARVLAARAGQGNATVVARALRFAVRGAGGTAATGAGADA